ncbi:unnamed protein product [Rhodiola kirilowii]
MSAIRAATLATANKILNPIIFPSVCRPFRSGPKVTVLGGGISHCRIRCLSSDSGGGGGKKVSARLSQMRQLLQDAEERAFRADDEPAPKITLDHVTVSFARSGGPGGQNVNKVNTKVDMRFNVKNAYWLSDRIRDRILIMEKNRINKDGEIVISSTKTRTQKGNIEDALEKVQLTEVKLTLHSKYIEGFISLKQIEYSLAITSADRQPGVEILTVSADRQPGAKKWIKVTPFPHPSICVLDIWTCILNKKEELRENTEFLRFFCNVDSTYRNSALGYHSIERQQQLFETALNRCLGRHPDVNLSKISMLFFPVYHDEHIIIVCYDFKRKAIEILDNHVVTKPEDIIYSGAVQNLTSNLVAYLKGKGHLYSQLLTKISPVVPLTTWATKKSNNSNVIFVMRCMETYFGGGVKGWNTGLRKEGAAQNAQLKLLRQRYLSEIVRFELNTVRSEVLRKSAEYRRKSLERNREIRDENARLP